MEFDLKKNMKFVLKNITCKLKNKAHHKMKLPIISCKRQNVNKMGSIPNHIKIVSGLGRFIRLISIALLFVESTP